MIRMNASLAAFLLPMLLLTGCDVMQQAQNAANRQKMFNSLKQVGLAYHAHHDRNRKGPSNWKDLETAGLPADVSAEVQGAGYVVIWGVALQDVLGGTSYFIAAFPPDAATAGGSVLFLDGSVREMTAQEFNETYAKQKVESSKAMVGAPDPSAAAAPAAGGPSGPGPPGPPSTPSY